MPATPSPWSTTIDESRTKSASARLARTLEAAAVGGISRFVYSDLHDTIHRPARRMGLVLLSLMRDRVPAAMSAMRVHLLAVTLLFIVLGGDLAPG
jgi:hypothetical protein